MGHIMVGLTKANGKFGTRVLNKVCILSYNAMRLEF